MRAVFKDGGQENALHPDLTIDGVLAHALPPGPRTSGAPDKCVVPVVFGRHPSPPGVDQIEGRASHEELAAPRHGEVTGTPAHPVHDRAGRLCAWAQDDRVLGPGGHVQAWIADGGVYSRVGTPIGRFSAGIFQGLDGGTVGVIVPDGSDPRATPRTTETRPEIAPRLGRPAPETASSIYWSTTTWSGFLSPDARSARRPTA